MATGFSFGGTPATSGTTAATGGFSFGGSTATPAASSTAPAAGTGVSFGATTAAVAPFGAAKTTGGLTIGIATPNTASSGFSLGSTTTTGFSLGGATATTAAPTLGAATGFSLGAPAAKPSLSSGLTLNTSGLSLGVPAPSTGLSFGSTATSTAPGLAGFKLGGATGGATGLIGGLGGNLLGSTSTSSSIFNTTTTSAASIGLGGVDPKTSTASSGGTGTNGKSSDVKALKETIIPNLLVQSVDNFQKYIKEEKEVREGIARMSNKPIIKVREDISALKQLLSVVSNTLQRNTCAVVKLKREMTMELKNSEMATRTKDTPPGLQYENTAPTLYFQALVEDFGNRMLTYRQQIEVLENHLASLYQPNRHSPAELIALLRKLHETFIALAANLQQVHEAVKTLKEHYLNYRKIIHGDNRNIFEKQQKVQVRQPNYKNIDQTGPNPFTGVTNAAAVAMASVLTRSQQPAGAPPVVGLTGGGLTGGPTFGQTSGFGLGTSTLGTSGLGTSTLGGGGLFGGSTLGSTPGSNSIFGNTSTTQPALGTGFGLGTPQIGTASPNVGSPFTLSSSTNQPFTLDKPPSGPGGKRNKR